MQRTGDRKVGEHPKKEVLRLLNTETSCMRRRKNGTRRRSTTSARRGRSTTRKRNTTRRNATRKREGRNTRRSGTRETDMRRITIETVMREIVTEIETDTRKIGTLAEMGEGGIGSCREEVSGRGNH